MEVRGHLKYEYEKLGISLSESASVVTRFLEDLKALREKKVRKWRWTDG